MYNKMTGFICKKCGFRFESQGTPKLCPYCGSSGVEKEKTAEELVDSIDVED